MDKQRRFHLILDAKDCELEVLTNKEKLKSIIQDLARISDMKIIYGPIVIEGVPINPGISGFAIIDFSQISIHTFTDDKEFCLDVFSCKSFDYERVKKYVIKAFNIKDESKIKYREINL